MGSTSVTPTPTPVVLPPTPITPEQHKFHVSLGQIVGLSLLALQAYHQQDAPGGGGPTAFENPAVILPYLQGVLSLFPNSAP